MAMTAKDLINNATDILKRRDAEVEVDIKGVGRWCFYVPSSNDIKDAQAYAEAHNYENSDPCLIYQCIKEPKLTDMELVNAIAQQTGHEAVAGPWILNYLLLPGQVRGLADILLDGAGFNSDSTKRVALDDRVVAEDLYKGADELKK